MQTPLKALSWMVLNEVEASSDRLPDLADHNPADAQDELRDITAAVDWLEACGADVTDHRGAMLNDEETARILALPVVKVPVCVWYAETGKRGAGWYWDTAEDSGGFDRISPMGPFADKCGAQAAAEKLFKRCEWFDGLPDHYDADAADYGKHPA